MHELNAPGPNRPTRTARFFNHLHRYKDLLQRRWWLLPLMMALGLGIQAYRIFSAPPAYISVGKMIVSIRIQTKVGSTYSEPPMDFLGTQVALMKSSTVLSRAAEWVAATKPNIKQVPVKVDISISAKTTIFNWQVTGPSSDYPGAYLDACMDQYMKLKKEMRASTSEATLESISDQLAKSERELRNYEDELLRFQASNSVVFLQEQGKGADSFLAQLNSQLAGLKIEHQLLDLLTLDQNLERAQKDSTAIPATGNSKPLPNLASPSTPANLLHSDYLKARQEIQLQRAELKEWSEYLKPKHPRIIALNEDIARREKLLEIFKEQSQEQLDSRRNSLSLQITNLQREIKEWEIKSLDISKKMADYERIRAGKQRVQSLYDQLLSTMQTLGVDKEINPESVAVLEKASPPMEAHGNAAKHLIIGALLGLIAGGGILLLIDHFDDRPTSFTDLQDSFDEPILGQIPFEKPTDKRSGLTLIQDGDQRHALLEAYRNLRSSLLYMATEGKRPKIIAVTSAIPSDGKSMTTASLAVTMALAGSRVLLIDADMRKGLLHRQFKLEPAPGLNEVLTGAVHWSQAAQATPTTNLFLLPRGNFAHNPGEMFLSQKTRDLLKELATHFDYVIIDTAPVMAADDVTSLAPHVEGVIFVIRAGYTSARVARAALDLLYQREVDVLGVALNGVKANASEYYYYRYKDYYSKSKDA